jgi:transcriptional regulator with PAS, ATPase and Fis domain/serine/threonine protein kinase
MDQILDYKVIKKIGSGSFSQVYHAEKENKEYAIKLMHPPEGADAKEVVESLRYEFWVLKDIQHPNIVKIYDFGSLPDGRVFIVEELFTGQSLDVFCQGKKFSDIEPILLQIIDAVGAIHRWKLIHSDIKPENILIEKVKNSFTAKLLDFGLCRPVSSYNKSTESDTPSISGTLATMAPEILLRQNGDTRSDLYSLGVTFYECLAGKNPFIAKNVDETINRHLTFKPDSIGLARDDVPPNWQQILDSLLEKKPHARPSSIDTLLQTLKAKTFQLDTRYYLEPDSLKECIKLAKTALQDKKNLAIEVSGPGGVGNSRFCKELFFSLIYDNPAWRDQIHFQNDNQPGHKQGVLILDQRKALSDYPTHRVLLKPFTKKQTEQWLSQVLNTVIPAKFLESTHQASGGIAKEIITFLNDLNQKGHLTDASGKVTATKLNLVPWDELFHFKNDEPDDFDYLYLRLKRLVHQRLAKPDNELWQQLQNVLEKSKNDKYKTLHRAQLLALKGACLIDFGDFEQAKELLIAAHEIYKTNELSVFENLKTQNFLAYLNLRQGNKEKAIQLFEDSLNQANEKLQAKEISKLGNLDLGAAYLDVRQFEKAIKRLEIELKQHEDNQDMSHKIQCLYNLALAHTGLDKEEEAMKLFLQVVDHSKNRQDLAYLLRAYNGLGNLLQKTDIEKSLEYYQNAIETSLAIKDYRSAAASLQNIAGLRSTKGAYTQAIENLELCLVYIDKIPRLYAYEKMLQCRALEQLGWIYTHQKQYEQSETFLTRAWNLAENDEDLAGFRFWVLATRCRHWLIRGDAKKCKQDLAQLHYYAKDDAQKNIAQNIKNELETKKLDLPTERELKLEDELKKILIINQNLVGDMPLDELLGKILTSAIELSKSELGVILIADEKGNLMPKLSLNAKLDDDLTDISMSVAKQALSTGDVVQSADAGQDKNFNQYASVMALSLKSILGVPIQFKGKVLGVLYLSHRYRVGAYDDRIIQIMTTFARQAGLAIKNHELLQFYKEANAELSTDLASSQKDLLIAEQRLKELPDYLERYAEHQIITRSAQMGDLLEKCEKLAQSNIAIVIHGESGTGKELLARFIHYTSPRKKAPFIAINCGAIPNQLVESELFGHKRGAFTGADRDKTGLIEAANGGTLFLDEIADLPLEVQVKLLRVLQEKEITRVGETRAHKVEVRVVAASHKSIKDAVSEGTFREDLYYRIAGIEFTLPPLRERKEDISHLAEHFLAQYRSDNEKDEPQSLTSKLLKKLMAYRWPGNIRELKNVIEVGALLSKGKTIQETDLPDYVMDKMDFSVTVKGKNNSSSGWYDPEKTWKEHELLIYASALSKFEFDTSRAAESLGVGVATVYKWMRENNLKETWEFWKERVLPYDDGLKLTEIRKHVFDLAAKRHPGHPYLAAKELSVAPVTFYRWSKD